MRLALTLLFALVLSASAQVPLAVQDWLSASALNQSSIITEGLVGYWVMDDNTNSASDASGFNNPIIWTNGPTVVAGIKGTAMRLDGGSQWGWMTNMLGWTTNTVFTLCAWVKTTDGASPLWYFGVPESASRTPQICVGYNDQPNGIIMLHDAGGGYNYAKPLFASGNINIKDGGWHLLSYGVTGIPLASNVVFCADGVIQTAYGANDMTGGAIKDAVGSVFTLGRNYSVNQFSAMDLDEVRIYNRLLTTNEVLRIYNGE
jgi:hypothetical protein